MQEPLTEFVPIGDPWSLRELDAFLQVAARETQSNVYLGGSFEASFSAETDIKPGKEPRREKGTFGLIYAHTPKPRDEPYADRKVTLFACYTHENDLLFHCLRLARPDGVSEKRATWREYRERVCAALLKAGAGRLRVGYPES
ncbi:MAG: hypothetical protein HYW25_02710 [Candidatus Aenigmarchaeota archaeon]|nr:hypothetical protein [Candidatus Aenigmarchaeota archaeon]